MFQRVDRSAVPVPGAENGGNATSLSASVQSPGPHGLLSPELLPYGPVLHDIAAALRTLFPAFPLKGCGIASQVIEHTLHLPLIVGRTPLDEEMHCCNEDKGRGIFVDLSLCQYDQGLPKIAVIPLENPIFVPDREFSAYLASYGPPDYMREQLRTSWLARLSDIDMANTTIPAVLVSFFDAYDLPGRRAV